LLLAYFVVENFNPVLKMRKWLTPQTGISLCFNLKLAK